MLSSLRKAGKSWIGKLIVAILFSLLIGSFAVWGIGDIFRNPTKQVVASIGKTDITSDALKNAFQIELQRLSRQFRQTVTAEQAKQAGVDKDILNRLIAEAVLDEKAKQFGLNASDKRVIDQITKDPAFKGITGQFDKATFQDALRNAGLKEAAFINEQRAVIARIDQVETLTLNLNVPMVLKEAIHRYGSEQREAAFIVLNDTGTKADPTEDELKSTYENNKTDFSAPDYRGVNLLILQPKTLSKPDLINDADISAHYESIKKQKYLKQERRAIQQIVFPTLEEARKISAELKAGASFEKVASERQITGKSLDLGIFTQAELYDPLVASTAFSLTLNTPSEPVQGRFGISIIRVTSIEPESVRPLSEVTNEIRQNLALERAKTDITNLHTRIDDLRANAQPLVEIAKTLQLPLVSVEAIDRNGNDKAGKRLGVLSGFGATEAEKILTGIFNSAIGIDNDAITLSSTDYVWFDITSSEKSRIKPFEEVKEKVQEKWQSEQVDKALSEKAAAIKSALDKGEAFDQIAKAQNVFLHEEKQLTRAAPKGLLTNDALSAIFATPVSKAGTSLLQAGTSRVVFKVISATVPVYDDTAQAAGTLENRLRSALADDVITAYISALRKDMKVHIDNAAVKRALGGEL